MAAMPPTMLVTGANTAPPSASSIAAPAANAACTEALAWMGADIGKVENPRGGEDGRTGFGDAYYFMMYNANKRSITVNLKSDRGLALVKEMVKKADVFTENFAPGAVERENILQSLVHQ
jgi:crotonobetainyl-CoA:carnitine CoA-transferase CaiB-like acyl-CoA transferase